MTSLKISEIALASARVSGRLQIMMPPKGACLSVAKRLVPGRAKIRVGAHAAGVCVLEDGDGRFGELGDERGGGADVEDVVIGELLALELLERRAEVSVEFGLLVRVLAVAKAHFQRQVDAEGAACFLLTIEVIGNRRVVRGGGGEGLDCERARAGPGSCFRLLP